MGLIELASANSIWRGMDYYEKKRVVSWEPSGDASYDEHLDWKVCKIGIFQPFFLHCEIVLRLIFEHFPHIP